MFHHNMSNLCPSIEMRLQEVNCGAGTSENQRRESPEKMSIDRMAKSDSFKNEENDDTKKIEVKKENRATNRRRKSDQPMKLIGAKKIVLISLTSTILLFGVSAIQSLATSHQYPIKHVNTLGNYHQYLSHLLLHLEREQRQHMQSSPNQMNNNNINNISNDNNVIQSRAHQQTPLTSTIEPHNQYQQLQRQSNGWQPYWNPENDNLQQSQQQTTKVPLVNFDSSVAQNQDLIKNPSQSQSQIQKPDSSQGIYLGNLVATTPTLNRQITRPMFYEMGLASTKAIQIESVTNQDPEHPTTGNELPISHHSIHSPMLVMSNTIASNAPKSQSNLDAQREGRMADMTSGVEPLAQDKPAESVDSDNNGNNNGNNNNNGNSNNNGKQTSSKEGESRNTQLSTDSIEPRQKRRMWNRILKKAEWNYLFVELSKVFLRYFLDLALKDIVGKQGGSSALSSSGSSGSDGTTSRKKLDAQSEIADVLKEFVKTAISNL